VRCGEEDHPAHQARRLHPDTSGLGESAAAQNHRPAGALDGEVKAVIELASFQRVQRHPPDLLDQLTESIGVVLNMIAQHAHRSSLLQQSQGLTWSCQTQSQS